jgi:nitrogen PTS system EIIA component
MQIGVRDVMRILNVPEKTVHRWISEGLPAACINGQYRFNRAELLEWANARKIPVSGELFDKHEAGGATTPSLATAIESGGVFYGVQGTDKESALRAAIERMPLAAEVDRQLLLGVLMAREALASTGIGDGFAIPHVRNPIVLHVPHPLITLCFLSQPIEFAAIDGKPVHTLFSVISPTVRAHLQLLSRLCFALRDESFKAVLQRQATAAEIVQEARRVEVTLPS